MVSHAVGMPYPGLRAFRHVDHDRFFGRTASAAAVAEAWQAHRLTIVSGPVASGKTSLLQAGVYPLMTGRRWDILPPGRLSYDATFPYAALPHYNSYTLALLRSWLPDEVATRLVGLTVSDFMRRRSRRHSGLIFAAIDHTDDLLSDPGSGPRAAWRRQFLEDLAQAVRDEPRLHLLLVTRSEALEQISAAVGHGSRYAVAPLTREGALEAVTGPAAGAGRAYADGAAEKLVYEVQTSEEVIEPALLQVICARLWLRLPADEAVITARDVRAFGDADAALAEYCGQVLAAVSTDHDLTAKRLHSWMCNTFIVEPGTRPIVHEGAVVTAGMPNAVVRSLVDRHLITTGVTSGLRWYQLLSDRLVDPLRKATDEPPPAPEPAGSLQAAERALTLGELDIARQYAEQALHAPSGFRLRAQARCLLGNLAYERDDPNAAEVHYREAASLFEAAHDTGASALQLAAVGQMLLAQGRIADAVAELRAAVDRVPNDLVLQTELARAIWQLGEGRAAVAILTSILAIDGGNPDALRARGEILADLGDARTAMLDLDRQRERPRPMTMAARGLALASMGDHTAARQEIDDAVADAPRNGPVLLYAARAFALSGDRTSSGELARRAVNATDPPLSPPHRQIALRLAADE